MTEISTSFGYSIKLSSGWEAETRVDRDARSLNEYVAIIPESKDALLRLTQCEFLEPDVDAVGWVEFIAGANRDKGRYVSTVHCGDFGVCMFSFSTGDEWLRCWALLADSVPLSVEYRCDIEDAGRDDAPVDTMLNTLRLNKQYTA